MPLFVVAGYKDSNDRSLEPDWACWRYGRKKASAYIKNCSEDNCGVVVWAADREVVYVRRVGTLYRRVVEQVDTSVRGTDGRKPVLVQVQLCRPGAVTSKTS